MRKYPPQQLLQPENRYDFFISYSHEDKEFALNIYYLAVANGLVPWLDDRDIHYGENIRDRALLGVHNSKRFLVLISKDSTNSDPVKEEIAEALEISAARNVDEPFNIIAYPIDGTEVPEYLTNHLYVKNREDHPLTAEIKLIQDITGTDLFASYLQGAYAGLLNAGILPTPGTSFALFNAYAHNILMQIRSLLAETAKGRCPKETLPTVQQLVNTSNLFGVVPYRNTWLALGNGVFELIHPVRSSRIPTVTVLDLPDHIDYLVCENNEVVTRLHFVHKGTTDSYLGPFPFKVTVEAEM